MNDPDKKGGGGISRVLNILVTAILALLVCFLAVKIFFVTWVEVDQASMSPTYSDGEKAEAPIIYGRNINALNGEINFDVAPLRAYEWENDGNIFRMWYLTWENPHPEKEIATIELKGNESNLPIYWFGLSMEE